jgi:hypothetical protein
MASRHSLPTYPPDLQFGAAAAADQRRVDDLLQVIDALLADLPDRRPRAANRARSVTPQAGAGDVVLRFNWLRPAALDADDAPVTTAAALEAAPLVNDDRGD